MQRKINKRARAGSLESNDLIVEVEPSDALEIKIKSVVGDMFYEQILDTVKNELDSLGVTSGVISVEDRGALDFAISARVRTAVKRGE